jgi:hypothetical protein
LFDETSCEKPIIIRFQKKKKIVQEVSIKTKFYRPHIISDSIQNNLVITDGCDLSSLLNLKIRVFGFGKIKMIVEVNTEEDTKVVMESYFKNLIQQAVATYSTDEEVAPEDERYSDTERILKAADAGYKSAGISDDIREKNLRDFREFLTNTKNSAKIIEEISKALENIFLEMLLFQFEKYPVDGVELSYGSPTLFASKFGDTMTIRFRYWDSMNNEYSPLDVVFNIDDQRTDKKPAEIPINIEWIRDPFEILIGDGTSE